MNKCLRDETYNEGIKEYHSYVCSAVGQMSMNMHG